MAARVLVVDDEPAILQVVGLILTRAGYEVLRAGGASRALNFVRENPRIDLVLSDVMMPEMEGPELVREVRRIAPGTATVLMSAGAGTNHEVLPPGTPVLRKPLSKEQLLWTVESVLAKSARAALDLGQACEQAADLRRQASKIRAAIDDLMRRAGDTVQNSRDLLERTKD